MRADQRKQRELNVDWIIATIIIVFILMCVGGLVKA